MELVAVLEPMSEEMQAAVQGVCPDLDLRFPASGKSEEMISIVGDARYIVTRGLRFPPEVLARAPRVLLIHQWGTGVDGIPLEAARARGIIVARSPGVNAPTVADLTLALMLAAMRRVPQTHQAFRAGSWEMPDLWKQARDLCEARVGLVGMGAIGQQVARRLAGFGCDIVYTRPSGALESGPGTYATLNDLLSTCDVVSLHLPLTAETRHLIGADELKRMKPDALLVNTSRGALVDEAALVSALVDNRLGGAALDVFEDEPTSVDNPLLEIESVVTLPHVAGRTLDNLSRMVEHWSNNIRTHAAGGEIPPDCIVAQRVV